MVDPHCVRASAISGAPTVDQSVARPELMIPDHSWEYAFPDRASKMVRNRSVRVSLIVRVDDNIARQRFWVIVG